jgi:hypothetical protein
VVPVVARLTTRGVALRHGLTFPAKSVPPPTRAQLVLLEGAGEEEFSRWIKHRADLHRWQGYHLRDSEGVIESLHTLRLDGYCDGLGIPDWRFWHEELGQTFDAELKGASGTLHPHQKREIASMRRGGIVCFEWWPKDALTIEHIFRYGLEEAS